MNRYIFISLFLLLACNNPSKTEKTSVNPAVDTSESLPLNEEHNIKTIVVNDSNSRFRNLLIEKKEDHFTITGQARVFEAVFHYMIQSSGKVLFESYSLTDAGAPEWGNFKIKLDSTNKYSSVPLKLTLYESSPKDGSKTHLLEIELKP